MIDPMEILCAQSGNRSLATGRWVYSLMTIINFTLGRVGNENVGRESFLLFSKRPLYHDINVEIKASEFDLGCIVQNNISGIGDLPEFSTKMRLTTRPRPPTAPSSRTDTDSRRFT